MWNDCAAQTQSGGRLSVCNLGEQACPAGHTYGPAMRGYYLIHYVLSGCGEYLAHGERHEVLAGQGFLILPGEITTYRADEKEPWHYVWIGYTGKDSAELTLKAGFSGDRLVFNLPEIEETCALLRRAQEEMRTLRLGELGALGALLRLMAHIGQHNPAPGPQTDESLSLAYFRKAAWFIEGSLTQGVTVTDVASFLGLCRSQLFRVFRKAAGMSPQEWIQRARLHHAEELLRDRPGLSLFEVALSAGYSSTAQMTAAFKKYRGATPGEIRKGTPGRPTF